MYANLKQIDVLINYTTFLYICQLRVKYKKLSKQNLLLFNILRIIKSCKGVENMYAEVFKT